MKKLLISISLVLFSGSSTFAACPSADLSGDCFVNFNDFAVMASQWPSVYDWNDVSTLASQWLTEGIPNDPCNLVWVDINDPGVSGHEGFNGEMSKYETTNAQYCQFLNDANASGDITVSGDDVIGASGPYSALIYYNLAGPGYTYDNATNGGAARINWTGSSFTVDSGFENHPVTYVSWYGSMAFASYYGWRLPTEWEWQAVADYEGTWGTPAYGCGPSINNSMANYYGSTHPDGTTVVGSFDTYGYGMADMAGNAFEWTDSIYSFGYRVVRGGCWPYYGTNCTVSSRFSYYHGSTSDLIGFRVCR